jgi:hypothetical protein
VVQMLGIWLGCPLAGATNGPVSGFTWRGMDDRIGSRTATNAADGNVRFERSNRPKPLLSFRPIVARSASRPSSTFSIKMQVPKSGRSFGDRHSLRDSYPCSRCCGIRPDVLIESVPPSWKMNAALGSLLLNLSKDLLGWSVSHVR